MNHYIGIDLGGTKTIIGICNKAKIIDQITIPTPVKEGYAKTVEIIALETQKLLAKFKANIKINGVGIGAAGQIDPNIGNIIYAPNLNWQNVPIATDLSKILNLPVKVTNDVRAATIAEWFYGAGKGLDNFVNIFLGTGIGSGLVINNKICEGVTNSAGEIGHICLDPDGPICGCGKRGCFEAYSSGRGIENEVKRRIQNGQQSIVNSLVNNNIDKITGKIIAEAAKQGDNLALDVLKWAGKHLGLVLANLHTFLNPQKILLGGGVLALADFFLPTALETMHNLILPTANRGKELIDFAMFKNEAVLIGAANLFEYYNN